MANVSYLHRHLSQRDVVVESDHHGHRHLEPYFPKISASSSSSTINARSPTASLSCHRQSQPSNFNLGLIDDDEDPVSDPDSVVLNEPDLLERENRVCFVMDLFQQRVEQSHVAGSDSMHEFGSHFGSDSTNELGFGVIEDSCEPEMDDLELDMELGFGLDCQENCGFQSIEHEINDDDYGDDDFFVERRVAAFESCEAESTVSVRESGVGVAGFESNSDSEQNENSLSMDFHSGDEYGLDHFNVADGNYHNDDNDNDEDDDDVSVTIPFRWDSLQLDDRRENNEDFEWEEVDGRVDEREVLSVFVDDEEASVSFSISPIISPEDLVSVERSGGLGNLEWQVLLNTNNLESNADEELDQNVEPYFGDHDDYIYTAEYEMLFGQFAENEIALMGRPPAAKSVVETLLSVVLTKEDVDSNNALCAVCKDDINIGESAKQLPCSHRYHGECIVPWLGIRNTCPVCRYELPTDDADYERKKAAQRPVTSGD